MHLRRRNRRRGTLRGQQARHRRLLGFLVLLVVLLRLDGRQGSLQLLSAAVELALAPLRHGQRA